MANNNQSIHVCMALHDEDGSYCRYVGVAIQSLSCHTQRRICFHLFHDKTLTADNREKLEKLCLRRGQKIIFYGVDLPEQFRLSVKDMPILKIVSEASLFRLMMADVLPKDIDKVLFIDADILCCMDVSEIWDFPLQGNLLAGKLDKESVRLQTPMVVQGVIPAEHYINAGVMLCDLAGIRRHGSLMDEALSFFREHPDCSFLDQDALNYIFQDRIGLLPEKFNLFTLDWRERQDALVEAMYHFAGDRPRLVDVADIDTLYYQELALTPWGGQENLLAFLRTSMEASREERQARRLLMKVLRCRHERPLAIFGAKSALAEKVLPLVSYQGNTDGCVVDNDVHKWGSESFGLQVQSPEYLWSSDKRYYVVVLSMNYYDEIKCQLEGHGLCEWEDFCDGRRLLLEEDGGYPAVK